MSPTLPPLMRAAPAVAPFEAAIREAAGGCDPGLVTHAGGPDLSAALVLTPEVALEDAAAMLPACGVGLVAALGALGPAEMAVQLEWDGGILVNGAACGGLRAAASTADPDAVPDWLVVGLEVPWRAGPEPGRTPERTGLAEEGCAELAPLALLEAWARHTLAEIHGWETGGPRPLHARWSALVPAIGGPVTVEHDGTWLAGTFLGADARFGMLLRTDAGTALIPLSSRLAAPVPA